MSNIPGGDVEALFVDAVTAFAPLGRPIEAWKVLYRRIENGAPISGMCLASMCAAHRTAVARAREWNRGQHQ